MYQDHADMTLHAVNSAPTIGATFARPAPHRPRRLSWVGRILFALLAR